MVKKSTQKTDLPGVTLSNEEKTAKLLIYFVQGVLFVVTAAGAFALLYLLGVFVF